MIPADGPVTIAAPKGRLLRQLAPRLARAGIPASALDESDRALVREIPGNPGYRVLLLKPDDVPTYVEQGAAEVGIVGRDVLLERGADVAVPLDLGIGRCAMAVAARADLADPLAVPVDRVRRVATKYVRIATAHFAARGEDVEVIYVQGSVEIAPLVGLADVIVDLVETGETLRQNGLRVVEPVCEISAVAIVNRVAHKLRRRVVEQVLAALGPGTHG